MSAPLIRATGTRDHAHGPSAGRVALDYEGRFLRRKVLQLADDGGDIGGSILVDLPKTTSLDHGSVLLLEDGREIAVEAAPEALLEITGDDLTRIAWHVGNRHTPCQIEASRLLIQPDHVRTEAPGHGERPGGVGDGALAWGNQEQRWHIGHGGLGGLDLP